MPELNKFEIWRTKLNESKIKVLKNEFQLNLEGAIYILANFQ